jgi:serine/threonine protein kinase
LDCEVGIVRLHLHKEGGQSEIYKAVRQQDSQFCAVKVVKNSNNESLASAFWGKEVECLNSLQHPNIVKMLGSSVQKNGEQITFKIVLEWLGSNLAEWLKSPGFRFDRSVWLKTARDLIQGMAFAHSKNIAHRDIKPENLLFRQKGDSQELVIADFGIGRVEVSEKMVETVAGFRSPIFAPTDHDSRDPYSRDVYSVTAVLLQMTTGEMFIDPADVFRRAKSARLENALPQELLDFFDISLSVEPDLRPKNMVDFKSKFEAIVKKHIRPQTKTRVYTVLTRKVRDQIKSGPSISSLALQTQFSEILNLEELYGRVEKDKKNASDELTVYLTSNEWSFVCKTKDFDTPVPILLVIEATRPMFDNLDRWRENSTQVSQKFTFVLLEETFSATANDGAKLLVSHIAKGNPDFSNVIAPVDLYETWSRVLDAKREYALGKYVPMEYRDSRAESGYFVFEVDPLPEGDLSQTLWRVNGLEGISFEISHVDVDGVWARPSRASISPPESGRLELSLGADGASLNRQRDAVAKLKAEMDSSYFNVAKAIETPRSVHPITDLVEFEPIMQNIDADKIVAVRGALSTEDVFVVEGPPGTGKTNFIAELVLQVVKENPYAKILLTAQTHVAVDNAMSRLLAEGFDSMLRIGDSERNKMPSEIRDFLVENRIRVWKDEINLRSTDAISRKMQSAGVDISRIQELLALREIRDLLIQRDQVASREGSKDTTSLADTVANTDFRQREIALGRIEDSIKRALEKYVKVASVILPKARIPKMDLAEVTTKISRIEQDTQYSSNLVELIDLQSGWLAKLPTDRDLQSRLIKRATLVAGTCVGVIREPEVREIEFDLCIIDEASKATATEALVPISFSKKILIVGDSNQLPPSEEELLQQGDLLARNNLTKADVSTTLFDHLLNNLERSKVASLSSQYRMARPIGDLVSNCFYGGKLVSINSYKLMGYEKHFGKQVRWLDTSADPERGESKHANGSYINRLEAKTIAKQVEDLVDLISSGEIRHGQAEPEILIVSMYLAQKQAIQDALNKRGIIYPNIRVETADAVQGTEADVVFVSITRSNPRNRIGFLDQPYWRRINVALSRAKFALILVGDAQFVSNTDGGLAVALGYIRETSDDCEVVSIG